jgi:hypothetical protein
MSLEIYVLVWDRQKSGKVKPINGIPTLPCSYTITKMNDNINMDSTITR